MNHFLRRFPRVPVALMISVCISGSALAQDPKTPGPAPGSATAPGSASPVELKQQPAVRSESATQQMILSATRAGRRIVAVGDHGNVLLSDDEGRSFRQAKAVPTRATLTSVSFADSKNGWAAGQWGVILNTSDGGETWKMQRSETAVDRPLFSILFIDKDHGWAVGLWSLILETHDGGRTWVIVKVPSPPEGGKGDRNLFQLFADSKGSLFVAAERGVVLRSDDKGGTWSYLSTGYNGSFWTGTALKDGTLIVAGLRGSVYRSNDDGKTWTPAKSENKSSITDLEVVGNKLYGVGLDGVTIQSADDGASFTMKQRDDRLALTSIVVTESGKVIEFSKRGPVVE